MTQRPDDAALVAIADNIQMRRKLLVKAKWLCDELAVALRELEKLVREGGLGFEEGTGKAPSIIVYPTAASENSGRSVEAYSLKMMARVLGNPRSGMLAATLDPARRQAREILIEALTRLYELVSSDQKLQDTKRRLQQASRLPAEETGPAPKPSPRTSAQRRDQLRQQLLKLRKVQRLAEQRPQAFETVVEQVFADLESGSLLPHAVTGKVLDLVYAGQDGMTGAPNTTTPEPAVELELELAPEAEPGPTLELPTPPKPEPVPATGPAQEPTAEPNPDAAPEPALELEPEPDPAPAAPSPAPAAKPATRLAIPERLDDWSAQGLEGNRLFRSLKADGDLERRIAKWRQDGKPTPVIERMFVGYFLMRIKRFNIDGREFPFELPDSFEPLDCRGFELLTDQAKAGGAYGIDPRLWGVVGSAFRFLKNAFAPVLRG